MAKTDSQKGGKQEEMKWWKFWKRSKPKPEREWDKWLKDQSAWMDRVFETLDKYEPDRARDVRARLEIMLIHPSNETPRKVTEMLVAELREIEALYESKLSV